MLDRIAESKFGINDLVVRKFIFLVTKRSDSVNMTVIVILKFGVQVYLVTGLFFC